MEEHVEIRSAEEKILWHWNFVKINIACSTMADMGVKQFHVSACNRIYEIQSLVLIKMPLNPILCVRCRSGAIVLTNCFPTRRTTDREVRGSNPARCNREMLSGYNSFAVSFTLFPWNFNLNDKHEFQLLNMIIIDSWRPNAAQVCLKPHIYSRCVLRLFNVAPV